ncbi:MAG TPA: DUF1549 domain-containing protein, partial [Verrucomicrobia bacterium]|nr:DUF1549 domain-containing protein [Verrucomicrobiota bacterium]
MNFGVIPHLSGLPLRVLLCGFRAIGLAFFFCGGLLTQASDELPASATKGEQVSIDWERARQFWAFQAPQESEPPSVSQTSWIRTKIDAFILSTMEAKGLSPAAGSDPGVLVRRLSFDLTGLPPEYHDVKAYLKKHDDRAYERLVDGFLDSLHFGERMAAIWMNLARYAEDQAHQVGNDTKHFYPNAYLYRDWVVQAFNDDLPYDRFIKLQLAADFNEQDLKHHIAALGFLGLGPKYYNRGKLEVQAEEWADRVDTVTRTFLGLTVACARCHDHKYDPITSADYYALAGVFAGTKMVNHPMKELELQEDINSEGNKSDKINKKKESPKPEETIHIVEEGEPRDLNVFIRGDVNRKGALVPRRFLQIL